MARVGSIGAHHEENSPLLLYCFLPDLIQLYEGASLEIKDEKRERASCSE